MTTVRELRKQVTMTQAELATASKTSQPAIAAYESGRKSPTLRTLTRMASALGLELSVRFVPPLTREDRRSLALHRAIAVKLEADPAQVLDKARTNLEVMRSRHEHAGALLDDWKAILERSVDEVMEVLLDPGIHARELRHVTPFAGVLSPRERASVYAEFRATEAGR
jgi:transcriptional regulator with XRE-family HTH domain